MAPMQNRLMVPRQEPGILDFAPGAAAAYSLRNLSLSYSGPVVTVRRSTDDAEADFTASEVSDGTLAAWCSGGDGFVKTWHDQSQNERDATQTTAGYQPQIVDAGALITEGGKAALQFDGVDDWLSVPEDTTPSNQPAFSFGVFSAAVKAASQFLFGKAYNLGSYYVSVTPSNDASNPSAIRHGVRTSIDYLVHTSAISDGINTLFSARYSNSLTVIGRDGADGASTPVTGAITYNVNDRASIGAFRSATARASFLQGTVSEIIYYNLDMTALRTRIEGNLAWYY